MKQEVGSLWAGLMFWGPADFVELYTELKFPCTTNVRG